uniref:Uncharacterized protein n=1 Tax=Rhizophora mucronata TaxID=61149 RepID=A0A2P2IV63_RHIMU
MKRKMVENNDTKYISINRNGGLLLLLDQTEMKKLNSSLILIYRQVTSSALTKDLQEKLVCHTITPSLLLVSV